MVAGQGVARRDARLVTGCRPPDRVSISGRLRRMPARRAHLAGADPDAILKYGTIDDLLKEP